MVQIISGEKGKGKTKHLLDRVNEASKKVNGNLVYLDKNTKKMHELNNKIRLINVKEYPMTDSHEFIGFLCGILSQDYDLEEMFLDSFLTISNVVDEELEDCIHKLVEVSDKYHVDFVLSISKNSSDLPDALKEYIVVDL
jgi:hypothetical protein